MGAWGSGNFENDDALDWLGEFSDVPSIEMIRDTLAIIVDFNEDYLELPECGAGIVAAEVVAALKGAPNAKLPNEIREWVRMQANETYPELIALSTKAIERIKSDSEMKELWEETDDSEEWHSAINDLQTRLKADAV